MSRLLVALGARPETLVGLSCMGDLVLTASSRDSRNMSLGVLLGEGQPLDTILAGRRAVSEGVMTAAAVVRLAGRHGIDMPIAMAVDDIVAGRVAVDEAITRLLARPLKAE
jgi:glycerol-3-phosphate dehydrogenase (NAD(P)+)